MTLTHKQKVGTGVGVTFGLIGVAGIVVLILWLTGVIFKSNTSNDSSSQPAPSKATLGGYASNTPRPLFSDKKPTVRPKVAEAIQSITGNAPDAVKAPALPADLANSLARAQAAQNASMAAARCDAPSMALTPIDPAILASVDQTGNLAPVNQTIAGDVLGHVMHSLAKPADLASAFHDGNLQDIDPEGHAELTRALQATAPSSWNYTLAEAQEHKANALARAVMMEANPEPSLADVLEADSVFVATREQVQRAINTQSQLQLEAVNCGPVNRFLYKYQDMCRQGTPLPILSPYEGEGTVTPGLENYMCETSCAREIVGVVGGV